MDGDEATAIVQGLYRYLLKRAPAPAELQSWADVLKRGRSVSALIEAFGTSDEYKSKRGVAPFYPPGHYYSPVVKPDDDVRRYLAAQRQRIGPSPQGIEIDARRMHAFFIENASFMRSAVFSEAKESHHRFHINNGGFPPGDALVLRAMINYARPKQIIEVGCGFSTACMLDTFDELGIAPKLTCIEPYPARLRSLLRSDDKVEILESPVQDINLERFSELERNDILFIDSTHVVKTGSDVHFEIFDVLPRLKSGVLIHFHDVSYPMEYPSDWIFERNYSWNEAYFLRAFLMYNDMFSVYYSNSYMALYAREMVRQHFPNFPANPGTGLWLVKTG